MLDEGRNRSICQICKISPSHYSCPRCRILYCSVRCYKDHGPKCVNQFHQENFYESLKNKKVTVGEKKEFERILKNFHDLNVDELCDIEDPNSESDEISEERMTILYKLALENKLYLDDLNDRETKCFYRDLKTGALKPYLKDFNPWWNKFISEEQVHNINHICCTNSRQASPRNSFPIIHLIYFFVHIQRTCHGNCADDLELTLYYLKKTCNDLFNSTTPPRTLNEEIDNISLIINSNDTEIFFDSKLNQICLVDTKRILSFKDFCIRALKELQDTLAMCANQPTLIKIFAKSKFKFVAKKLDFYISFVTYHWTDLNSYSLQFANLLDTKDLLHNLKENTISFDDTLGSKILE